MRDTYPLLLKSDFPALRCSRLETLQANVGCRCNQSCFHCHVAASPKRTEEIAGDTMELILQFARRQGVATLDLTGVMCKTLISVNWQGHVHDCDFNQLLGMPLGGGAFDSHSPQEETCTNS